MGKKAFIGASSKARQAKKMYLGVDGKARKVKKGFIGVGGKAHQFLSSGFDAGWVHIFAGHSTIAATPKYRYYNPAFVLIHETSISVTTTQSQKLQYAMHAGIAGALFAKDWIPNYFTGNLNEIDILTGTVVSSGGSNPNYISGDGLHIIGDFYVSNINRRWDKIDPQTFVAISSNTYSSSGNVLWGGSYDQKFWKYGTYSMSEYYSTTWAQIRSVKFPNQSTTGSFDCLGDDIYATYKGNNTGVLYHIDYLTGAARTNTPGAGVSAYFNIASIKST